MRKAVQRLEQLLNQLENQLSPPHNEGESDEITEQELKLSSQANLLHQKLKQLKQDLASLVNVSQNSNDLAFISHKLQQISDQTEALARTIILQKQNPSKKKHLKKPFNKDYYQPDLTQPELEMAKLTNYEKQLEQKVNHLIDISAPLYQVNHARERLQRCRDALGLVRIHYQESSK